MKYLHPRTALIADAEATSHHAVAATARKMRAYRDWYLADPFAESTYQLALDRATAEQEATLKVLMGLVVELCQEGLGTFACNLWTTTVRKCEVAIDLASFELVRELGQSPCPRKESSREPQGNEPRTPAARPGRPADAAGSLSDLRPADPPRPQGRALDLLRRPAPVAAPEGGARCI